MEKREKESVGGSNTGAVVKNDQKRPEFDQNTQDFDQMDIEEAIEASMRTANNPENNDNNEQNHGDRNDNDTRGMY